MHDGPLTWWEPARRYAPYLLLIPVLALSLMPGPVLLGNWESLTFYHTFGAVSAPLSFLIAPRANIGGQGYALLEIARPIIGYLHLPLSLSTFRIPAIVFGAISLLLFFSICRRYFGPWPASGATALLAANQVFFQAEHMMTVLVISGAALLFVIERLQALEVRYWDSRVWAGLALALAVTSLHYGPARLFALALLGLWCLKVYRLTAKSGGRESVLPGIALLASYALLASVLVLTLLDYRNLFSVLHFRSFLFPRNSEVTSLTGYPEGVSGLLRIVWLNAKITSEAFLGRVGDYNSQYSSYLLADFRYPLLDRIVSPMAIGGLVVAIGWRNRRTAIFATPWGNLLVLLGVLTIPLLFSQVAPTPDGPIGTLSTYRLFFCLFGLHLLVGAFFHFVGNAGVRRKLKYAVGISVAAAWVTMVANLRDERARFAAQVFAPSWQEHGPEIRRIWDDGAPNLDRRSVAFITHFQQHAQYANVARIVARRLAAGRGAAPSKRRLIFVSVDNFSASPSGPASLGYIENRNFRSIFLASYFGEEGVQVNPIVMIDPDRPQEILGGVGYNGEPRGYSALTAVDSSGALRYQKRSGLIPVLVRVSGRREAGILVTTPEEEAGARALLSMNNTPFDYIRFDRSFASPKQQPDSSDDIRTRTQKPGRHN